MIKRLSFLLYMLLAYLWVAAQSTERYYDYQGNRCDASRARFYAKISRSDSGWTQVRYYLPSGRIQSQTHYTDSICSNRDGMFYSYYPNKQLETIGRYSGNRRDSTWLSFYPDGVMKDSTDYIDGEAAGTSLHWHSNGYISDSTVYRPDGVRVAVSWFDDGTVSSAGRISEMGLLQGKWQFFHRNGKLSAEENYDHGKLLSRKYYSVMGVPETDTSLVYQPAVFPGGVPKWSAFLQKNLYWPRGYQIVNGEKAEIGVEFTVDEFGNVKDVFISVPFEDHFNEIVLRAMKNSPRWEPAISHNRKVAYRHKQTISFGMLSN